MTLVAIFIALVFFLSLVSGRLERTIVTAPIVFTGAGMLAFLCLPGLRDRQANLELLLQVAEVGLVLLLFTDASRTDLKVLKKIRNLPVRLLSTGMLLTILLGALGALAIFPKLSLWEAGILAAILAPTDAGLGQIIVNSPRVPTKIRQALNVEAGLNDGLSVPFLLFFIALGSGGAQGEHSRLIRLHHRATRLRNAGRPGHRRQRRLAPGSGASPEMDGAFVGATRRGGTPAAVPARIRKGWRQHVYRSVRRRSGSAGGFQGRRQTKRRVHRAMGTGVQLLRVLAVRLAGRARLAPIQCTACLYALLSLTVVRMLPVAIALIGTRLSRATVLFMGWFGPRGLASIVLGIVYLEQHTHQPGESTIRLAVMATVLISIFAHGLSALPGMDIYARKISALPPAAAELEGSPAEIRDLTANPAHHHV